MRRSARVLVVAFLSLLGTALLGIGAAFVSALALAATTALIVPGTGTPNANIVSDYMQHAADRYIAPFDPSCTSATCNLQGINYPASFFPLVIFPNWCRSGPNGCDTWNDSVGQGVMQLNTQLMDELNNTSDNVVLFGYSQGGAVVSDELGTLGSLSAADKARLQVVMIGNAYNPDGGLFTRLGFLPTIPILNVSFGPAMPTNTGIPIASIGFQYDPVMYAPKYWGNPFAMLNALAAFETVHGYYLTPNGNGPTDPIAYNYTTGQLQAAITNPANQRKDSNGNVYVMIPATSLPIADFVLSETPSALQPVVKPVVDLVSPVWKVLADLGYDWTGNPGKESFLSILPFNPIQNWPAVGVNLVTATVQGVQAFIGDLGGLTSLLPATTKPATTKPATTMPTTTPSTLAAAKVTAAVTTKATVTLSAVKTVTAPPTAAGTTQTGSTATTTATTKTATTKTATKTSEAKKTNHPKPAATTGNGTTTGTDKKSEGSAKAAA